MIIEKLENAHLYKNIGQRISKSFDYIKTTNLKNLPAGNYPIDGENIFAFVCEYLTKHESEGKLEVHKKYFDVQYVINGEELIGYFPFLQSLIICTK